MILKKKGLELMKNILKKAKKGFTLAEILITLSIIGVVSVLYLPSVVENVQQRALDDKDKIETRKLEEALSQMRVRGDIKGYATHQAFLDKFSNYMKFAKKCTVANMDECFPSKFFSSTNKEYLTADLKTGANLGHSDYGAPLVGAIFANGTHALIAFNPNCEPPSQFSNSTDPTECLAIAYDLNGQKEPNKMGKDIRTINASITECDGIIVGSLCVDGADLRASSTLNTCGGSPYDSQWTSGTDCHQNRWAHAVMDCDTQGKRLPSIGELQTLYTNRTIIESDGNWPVAGTYQLSSNHSGANCTTLLPDGNLNSRVKFLWGGGTPKYRCVKAITP